MTLNMNTLSTNPYSVDVDAGALSLSLDGNVFTNLFQTGVNGEIPSTNYTPSGSASPTSPGASYSEYGLNRWWSVSATEATKIGQMDRLLRGYSDGPNAFSSAAVQLALWTIEFQNVVSGYDPSNASLGFSASNVNSNVLSDTNLLLADVQNGTFEPMDTIPGGFEGDSPQQTLVPAVPEPSTYAIMAVGLLAMMLVYRRKMV